MVQVGKWILGDRDTNFKGVSDKEVLQLFQLELSQPNEKPMVLVGLTLEGPKTWTKQGELKEMQGHLRGLIRSKYGREMLDARKLNIAFSRHFRR